MVVSEPNGSSQERNIMFLGAPWSCMSESRYLQTPHAGRNSRSVRMCPTHILNSTISTFWVKRWYSTSEQIPLEISLNLHYFLQEESNLKQLDFYLKVASLIMCEPCFFSWSSNMQVTLYADCWRDVRTCNETVEMCSHVRNSQFMHLHATWAIFNRPTSQGVNCPAATLSAYWSILQWPRTELIATFWSILFGQELNKR